MTPACIFLLEKDGRRALLYSSTVQRNVAKSNAQAATATKLQFIPLDPSSPAGVAAGSASSGGGSRSFKVASKPTLPTTMARREDILSSWATRSRKELKC